MFTIRRLETLFKCKSQKQQYMKIIGIIRLMLRYGTALGYDYLNTTISFKLALFMIFFLFTSTFVITTIFCAVSKLIKHIKK